MMRRISKKEIIDDMINEWHWDSMMLQSSFSNEISETFTSCQKKEISTIIPRREMNCLVCGNCRNSFDFI